MFRGQWPVGLPLGVEPVAAWGDRWTWRRGLDPDQAESGDQLGREFLEIDDCGFGAAMVEDQESEGCGNKKGGHGEVAEGAAEGGHFELRGGQREDGYQEHGAPKENLNMDFSGQVGTGEGDFVEANQTEFDKDPSDEAENGEVSRGRQRRERERQQGCEEQDRNDGEGEQGSSGSGDVLLGWLELRELPYPVGGERDGQRENGTETEDRQAHHQKCGGEKFGVQGTEGWVEDDAAQQGKCDRKYQREIEGESETMLAAAGERAGGEECDCGLQRTAEAQRPVGSAGSGDEVGLFYRLLHGAQITEQQRKDRSRYDDCETEPTTLGKPSEICGQRSVQLIEEGEEP